MPINIAIEAEEFKALLAIREQCNALERERDELRSTLRVVYSMKPKRLLPMQRLRKNTGPARRLRRTRVTNAAANRLIPICRARSAVMSCLKNSVSALMTVTH